MHQIVHRQDEVFYLGLASMPVGFVNLVDVAERMASTLLWSFLAAAGAFRVCAYLRWVAVLFPVPMPWAVWNCLAGDMDLTFFSLTTL